MNELSGWWTRRRSGGWAVGLAQEVRQAMQVLAAFAAGAKPASFSGPRPPGSDQQVLVKWPEELS